MNLQTTFTVRFSAYGSGFLPKRLLEYPYIREEAERVAAEWRARADTVGGDAEVVAPPQKKGNKQ